MLHESRLKAIDKDSVTFSYKDYADNNRSKQMRLKGEEFLRRYLSHILPKGLMRVRHFGFLANRCRRKKLSIIRRQLPKSTTSEEVVVKDKPMRCWHCPVCKVGILMLASIASHGANTQRQLSG
jgi:hypothetical protein